LDDGRFEYIPIPESKPTTESRRFSEIPGRWGETLAEYASNLADEVPHFDPEFTTYTYGDSSQNKRSQLRRLGEDDLLIFYAGLKAQSTGVTRRYVIG
jgi:hypothetical protein